MRPTVGKWLSEMEWTNVKKRLTVLADSRGHLGRVYRRSIVEDGFHLFKERLLVYV